MRQREAPDLPTRLQEYPLPSLQLPRNAVGPCMHQIAIAPNAFASARRNANRVVHPSIQSIGLKPSQMIVGSSEVSTMCMTSAVFTQRNFCPFTPAVVARRDHLAFFYSLSSMRLSWSARLIRIRFESVKVRCSPKKTAMGRF